MELQSQKRVIDETVAQEGITCVCQQRVSGDMVACDGEVCQSEWFHQDCDCLNDATAGES